MIEQLLQRVARALEDHRIDYMVIGGQAVLIYGRVRVTRDIDITLGFGVERLNDMLRVCKESGLRVLSEKPQEFAADTMVLPTEDAESNIRVDFIFSCTPYETNALKRATAVKMKGNPVRFAAPEDVIIHKMVAGRAIDIEDAKSILIKSRSSIDLGYIRKWLREFSRMPGSEEALRQFETLLKDSGHNSKENQQG